ncbi:putative bifunctional diguanylate cyclase/phosphodiesterase [Oceanospirillum sanctuarii]|uniref:putative bifunctional diguanylate cyclase/phosphodiesterase n=1 Tax=Oceanospirillum sanctuarii TaxID=1434821 RepID=UPI000A35F402|nr:EAL domain-containing protein [Oceanospirillum sanctuarii]
MFNNNNDTHRILLVDDDASQITLLNKALKDLGHVFFEQDGLAALNQALATRPDIILLDIEMPGLNGYEVLAQLKSNDVTVDIPVIFITSHDSKEDQLRCLAAGAVDFIVKPLLPEVVAARVQTHLSLRDRERRLEQVSRHARVTLESIGDGVITTDRDGRVTYMNPSAELMTGMLLSEALGQAIEEVMPLRMGDDGPDHINPVHVAMQEKREVGMAFNCQMLNQRGHWIAVEDSSTPLMSDTDEVIGAVIVFEDINESRAMALKMAHTLQYDQLTNLPNRFLLMERINVEMGQCKQNKNKLGLILIDVDRFKLINEEFGFDYGDALLKKIAQKISARLEQNQTLSRHNADQFMVLVPAIDSVNQLAHTAISIRENLAQIVSLYPELHNFSISIGLSLYPDDADDPQSLVMHADAALYRAKTDMSQTGLCFYSSEVESFFVSRKERYSQLKNAISQKNYELHYQPIVDTNSGETLAVEALLRVRDEQGRLIPPVDFISLAEDTKLIIPLGEGVIHLALAQLKQWNQGGFDLKMCINISPVQFLDPHFVPLLLSKLDEHQVPADKIELEVTENMMLKNMEQVCRDMQQLRNLGITISIDDFGTGFSSLSYLKELPIDVLKIDRSFITQIRGEKPDDTLTRTILNLANNMQLAAIAEGVETEEQLEHLKTLGINQMQGFYISHPVTANEVQARYLV